MAGVTEVGWPYTARSPYLVVVAVYTYAVSYFFLLENWKKIGQCGGCGAFATTRQQAYPRSSACSTTMFGLLSLKADVLRTVMMMMCNIIQ